MRYLLVAALLFFVPTSGAADRPNILFIAIDDLRPELGSYGARAITPNIDALAASGVRFERAYCNQAVCGASRLSLMTGLYPEYTGERSFHPTNWTEWIKVGGSQYANAESRKNMRTSKSGTGRTRRRGPATEAGNTDGKTYADSQRALAGVSQITKLAKEDKPFFLAVGFTKPHLSFPQFTGQSVCLVYC